MKLNSSKDKIGWRALCLLTIQAFIDTAYYNCVVLLELTSWWSEAKLRDNFLLAGSAEKKRGSVQCVLREMVTIGNDDDDDDNADYE